MEKQPLNRGNERSFFFNPNKIIPVLTVLLFLLLAGVSLYRLFYQAKTFSDQLISREVVQLVDVFKRIDKACKIISFDYQKNHINFLNIKKGGFVGSEVGPLNLTFPQNWEGPYMDDNPTIQQKEYQVVRTKKGYFITPGDGVVLSSGKVVGKDVILDENADIKAMMQKDGELNYKGKALAAPLAIGINNFEKVLMLNLLKPEEGLVVENRLDDTYVTMS